jgi:hypothetical protein
MKRKDFFKKTALSLVGSVFLNAPKLVNENIPNDRITLEIFEYPYLPETRNDDNRDFKYMYELALDKSMFNDNYESYENPGYSYMSISLVIRDNHKYTYYPDGSEIYLLKRFSRTLEIEDVRKNGNTFFLDIKTDDQLSFDYLLNDEKRTHYEDSSISDYDKYYINEFSSSSWLTSTYARRFGETLILSPSRKKSKDIFMTMDKVRNSDTSTEDCYLTTSCTKGKGLKDDCDELTILRKFRDDFIINESGNKELVQSYYTMAPDIVNHIENQSNSEEILDFIYNELVIKSIHLIQNGKKELAMYYYKSFAEELQKRILN